MQFGEVCASFSLGQSGKGVGPGPALLFRPQGASSTPSLPGGQPGNWGEGPGLWFSGSSAQNALWLQEQVILQESRQGEQGDEAAAPPAQRLANGTAAQVLQAARALGQGQEGLVEGGVLLEGNECSIRGRSWPLPAETP